MKDIRIVKLHSDDTMDYAVEELVKYLSKISSDSDGFDITVEKYKTGLEKERICLGHLSDFKLDNQFELKDLELDDAVYIDIKEGKGIIAGSNSRSVLLAVYRLLTEAGCRWVRPGKDGEIIVKKALEDFNVTIKEVAALRHRGIVIEGADSYENVADIIEWAPKVGYNSYFLQFKEAYTFFKNWYRHVNNPTKEPEAFTVEKARELTRNVEREIKKRGLIYHAVGHGWTSECIGISALGWDAEQHALKPEEYGYLAEVHGKRDFWYGIPMNTNLCYSNPVVRELMTDHIVDYIGSHDYIDFLHVWLADDLNNYCECEKCRENSPTDLYIRILNLLDEKLTKAGYNQKIVFLIYYELLWPPKYEKVDNPDRFILMFAPISRTFEKSYKGFKGDEAIPEYVRNKVVLPTSLGENLAFLEQWQKVFKGDSFDFDYPLGRAHYGDPGYYKISKVTSEDIKSLKNIELNGYMSCQEQRAFFPTGLPNYVMGLTLWNSDLPFESIAEDYFKNAFGPSWKECKDYLEKLSNLFDMEYWCAQKEWIDEEVRENMKKVPEFVENFRAVIEENLTLENTCWKKSWEYLNWHIDYCKLFAKFLHSKSEGNDMKIFESWNELKSYIQNIEDHIQPVFDVYRFIQIAEWKFKLRTDE
jgi:hypothetical protein